MIAIKGGKLLTVTNGCDKIHLISGEKEKSLAK